MVDCGESDESIKIGGKINTKGLVIVIFQSLSQEFLQTKDFLRISTFKQIRK